MTGEALADGHRAGDAAGAPPAPPHWERGRCRCTWAGGEDGARGPAPVLRGTGAGSVRSARPRARPANPLIHFGTLLATRLLVPATTRRSRRPLVGDRPPGVLGRTAAGTSDPLADLTARLLPPSASAPHRDPRAPQNLVPTGVLERERRRRLGDQRLLYRGLRAAVTNARHSKPNRWRMRCPSFLTIQHDQAHRSTILLSK